MSLGELPNELIGRILDFATWSSCENFSRTSRRNHALALPHLRREVLLLTPNGRTLRQQHGDVREALHDATSVVVASPDPDESVGSNVRGRCPACHMYDYGQGNSDEAWVHRALEKCRTGRLKKFTWLVGVCVQEDILGSDGVLPTRQPNLEELRLVTCYHRLGIRCQTRSLDLAPFSKLHTLSWTGIHRSQFRVVEAALAALAKQLVSLELDYLSSTTNRNAEVDQTAEPGYMPPFILSLRKGQDIAFPKLESLSFTNLVVETKKGAELGAALNLHRLKSFKMKQCPGWKTLLTGMKNQVSEGPFPLASLEIHSFPREDDRDNVVGDSLANALQLCPDLEELRFYKVSGTASFPDIGVLHRDVSLPKLRRVVVHEGSPLTGSLGSGGAPREVVLKLGRYPAEHNVLSHCKAEFIGHGGPIEQVKTLLTELAHETLPNLKVLHLRQDHEEVQDFDSRALGHAVVDRNACSVRIPEHILTPEAHDFATWAFTNPMFPSLELLAFGDFGSFDQLFRLMLCRSEHPDENFRIVGKQDTGIVALLDEYVDLMVVGPSYSRPYLRSSGASIAGNVWRGGLGRRLARESGRRPPTRPRKSRPMGLAWEGPFSFMIRPKEERVVHDIRILEIDEDEEQAWRRDSLLV